MKMLEITALSNGAHNNQTFHGELPEGWAVIPDDIPLPCFPFGEVEVAEVDGIMTVTNWTAGVMPEPVPMPEPEPTADDLIDILLGVTSNE